MVYTEHEEVHLMTYIYHVLHALEGIALSYKNEVIASETLIIFSLLKS